MIVFDMDDADRTLNVCVASAIEFTGVHHVGFLCENVEKSLDFYCGLLGMFLSCLNLTLILGFRAPALLSISATFLLLGTSIHGTTYYVLLT